MWLKARWLVVVFLCVFLNVGPAAAEWKASANLDATLDGIWWTSGTVGPDNRGMRGLGTLKIPANLRYQRWLRFRAQPLVQWDPSNVSKNERYYQDLQEGYMQLQALPWTLQAGYNIQTWGDTDVFNPLDVVNARRFYDPFRSEKMGAPTLLVKREWSKFFLEALWIPVQRQTLVPGDQSRWLPRELYKSRTIDNAFGPSVLSLPNNIRYSYQQHIELDHALKHNFGGRLKFRFSGFDWTLAGFQGASVAPAVNIRSLRALTTVAYDAQILQINVDPNTPIVLRGIYYKSRMVGTSFVWVLGDFLVKGASAYTKVISKLPSDQLPLDSHENALGLERSFSLGSGTLTALAQGTYVNRKDKVDGNSVSLARMFDKAAMAGLRWAPTEKVTATASVLYDLRYRGHFEHLDVSYKIADGWSAKIAGDLMSGKPETPIGTYDRNDRVTVSLNLMM